MYDAMFIVHALEQSPVYWNFCTLIKAGVYAFLSPLLRILNESHYSATTGYGPRTLHCAALALTWLSSVQLALCGAWRSFAEEEERRLKQLSPLR